MRKLTKPKPKLKLEPRRTSPLPSGTLAIDRNLIKKAHAKLPPTFDLTWKDCAVMLYAEQFRCVPYEHWPREFKQPSVVEKLRKRRYLKRCYWPTVYVITRAGFSLVNWIKALLEHVSTRAAA